MIADALWCFFLPWQIIFRFALALFKYKEEEFLKLQDPMTIFKYLRYFTRTILDARCVQSWKHNHCSTLFLLVLIICQNGDLIVTICLYIYYYINFNKKINIWICVFIIIINIFFIVFYSLEMFWKHYSCSFVIIYGDILWFYLVFVGILLSYFYLLLVFISNYYKYIS